MRDSIFFEADVLMQFLRESLEEDFDKASRARGEDYFASGLVRLRSVNDRRATAQVFGTEQYEVVFEADDTGVFGSCTCPFAEQGANCKHMWAALLAIEDRRGRSTRRKEDASVPTWKKELSNVEVAFRMFRPNDDAPMVADNRRVYFAIDLDLSNVDGTLVLLLKVQTRGRKGDWGRPKTPQNFSAVQMLMDSTDPNERLIGQILNGVGDADDYYGFSDVSDESTFELGPRQFDPLLKMIAQSGRLALTRENDPAFEKFLTIDTGEPWQFVLRNEAIPDDPENFYITGAFVRGDESIDISDPILCLQDGFLVATDAIARLEHFGAWPLLARLRGQKKWLVHQSQLKDFLQSLTSLPRLPKLNFTNDLQVPIADSPLKKILRLTRPRTSDQTTMFDARLNFDYGKLHVEYGDKFSAKFEDTEDHLVVRDFVAEQRAVQELQQAGLELARGEKHLFRLQRSKLHSAVILLNESGWHVEAEGAIYRSRAKMELRVSSGIDWFELNGAADFDGTSIALPRLLQAMNRGEKMITLDDGSMGIVPDEWLEQYAAIAKLGEKTGDMLKFSKSQVGLLDAMLETLPEAQIDETFDRVRKELRTFSGVEAEEPVDTFIGELRPYQKQGLGWLHFLQKFSFGGCLADDMGLGKTIQVLALLEEQRRISAGPSLVVAPRSLVFNWIQEAKRFTPELKVLDQSGADRIKSAKEWSKYDLILTTYGTLRRDITDYQEIVFNYSILDEAQAIKNANTESAKASRLIKAKHRLALSGTPVENHIGELWSIFEYLNPGMLGSSGAFKSLMGKDIAPESRQLLARALRPFILRRTKGQVAKDLPEKTEQTIYCDLDVPQRKLYDELRDYYRAHLLQQVDSVGLNKSKIMILESLLRLRQAACHPALVDEKHGHVESAKVNTLIEQLDDVLQEGHKALVFSQFTSFLSLVKKELDKRKIVYEYLDGQTRDRQARVERFQSDEKCQLFLISLKAGGIGLNLTAADYVYLLDPWWNPAVEAQAIDRTHRIGQTRNVFAYRIIARNTVEERVLELQKSKRELADAIINADNSLIGGLKREDLELLLS